MLAGKERDEITRQDYEKSKAMIYQENYFSLFLSFLFPFSLEDDDFSFSLAVRVVMDL